MQSFATRLHDNSLVGDFQNIKCLIAVEGVQGFALKLSYCRHDIHISDTSSCSMLVYCAIEGASLTPDRTIDVA